jgi:hypothetical protein
MSEVVIGMDPHKRSATIEIMAADETARRRPVRDRCGCSRAAALLAAFWSSARACAAAPDLYLAPLGVVVTHRLSASSDSSSARCLANRSSASGMALRSAARGRRCRLGLWSAAYGCHETIYLSARS